MLFAVDENIVVDKINRNWIGKPRNFVYRVGIDLVGVLKLDGILIAVKPDRLNLKSLIDPFNDYDVFLKVHKLKVIDVGVISAVIVMSNILIDRTLEAMWRLGR